MNTLNEDLEEATVPPAPTAAEMTQSKPERTPASPASVILPAVPSNDLAPIFLGGDGISSSSSSSSSPPPEKGEELVVEELQEAEGPVVVATVLDKKLEMLTKQRLARERLMMMTQSRVIQQHQQQHQQVSGTTNTKPTVTPSLADLATRAAVSPVSPKKASSSNKTSPPAALSLADLARSTRTTGGQGSPENPSTKNSLAMLAEAAANKKKEKESEELASADTVISTAADSATTNIVGEDEHEPKNTGNTIAAMQGTILSKLDKQKSTREIVLQKQKEFAIERAKDIQKENDDEEAEANTTCTTHHHLADKQAVILNKLDKDKFNREKWIRQREKKELQEQEQEQAQQQRAKNSKEEEEEEPQYKEEGQEPSHENMNEQSDLPQSQRRESSMTYQEGESVFTSLQEILKANPDLAIGLSLTEPALSESNDDNLKQNNKCNCNFNGNGSCIIL